LKALSFHDFSFRYRRAVRPALEEITLAQDPGEVLWVAGSTGAGKTTLCCASSGVVPELLPGELRGQVRLFGRSVDERRVREWADTVGSLFQDFEAQLVSTEVVHEIAFGPENLALPSDEIERRVQVALEECAVEHLRGRDPATLSGGEKQRLALASLLALEPSLLVLDEPTTDLDPEGKEELVALVRSLAERGRSLLVAEHLPESLEVAHRVLLLDEGRVVDLLTAQDALARPALLEECGVPPHPVPASLAAAGLPGCALTSVQEGVELLRRRGLRLATPPPEARVRGREIARVEALHHRFPSGEEVLRGVDLAIHEGESVAIVGPNGSGKTTLARLLAGLLRPTSGRILFAGREVGGPADTAGHVGLVFQDPDDQLFAQTIWEEVSFGPRNSGLSGAEAEKRVNEALTAVGLTGEAETDPFTLPKGGRQKVAVASALAQRPELLILDEPTTGLDARETTGMLELLGDLGRRGHAVLLVTHSMEVAAAQSDRIVVLLAGKVAADAPPREIFGNPRLLERSRLRAPAWSALSAPFGPTALTLEELGRRARLSG
jgi:energy-coupling factor transport system ATP-binding protein